MPLLTFSATKRLVVFVLFVCVPSVFETCLLRGQEASTRQQSSLANDVLTLADQAALKPETVIQLLRDGNSRFVANDLTARDHSAAVRKSAQGQFPKAIVLSCVDSRIPVEDVFDRGIGDIFVARVAGNFVNADILGSMEFACKVAGAKLVLVLGHEHCGAIKAAIDNVQLGNISGMLANIRPTVERVKYDGPRTSKNEEFVHLVAELNVRDTINAVRQGSPILFDMEKQGKIKIVGALYDMDSGVVAFLEP